MILKRSLSSKKKHSKRVTPNMPHDKSWWDKYDGPGKETNAINEEVSICFKTVSNKQTNQRSRKFSAKINLAPLIFLQLLSTGRRKGLSCAKYLLSVPNCKQIKNALRIWHSKVF